MPALRHLALLLATATVTLAAHARDAGSCKYVPIAELPITLSGPLLEPLIDGEIDGSKAIMLVDTGSSVNMITRATADKRHLPLMQSGTYAQGAGGATVLYGVKLKDFAAGPAHSGKSGMPVIGEMSMQQHFDAIVGAEFLLQADMELALTSRQLKFFRASDCRDTFLAYWDKDAMEIPFTSSDSQNLNPQFLVEINGKSFRAIIDTGASISVIMEHAAAEAGVNTDSPGVTLAGHFGGVGADQAKHWNANFATFSIGSETIANATIAIMQESSSGRSGMRPEVLLGRDFLRAHHILFAMSQQRLYVSYTGGPVFYKPALAATPAAMATPR